MVKRMADQIYVRKYKPVFYYFFVLLKNKDCGFYKRAPCNGAGMVFQRSH